MPRKQKIAIALSQTGKSKYDKDTVKRAKEKMEHEEKEDE